MNLKMGTVISLLFISLVFLNPRNAFSGSVSALSPEAQAAFQKGMAAAEQGAWDIAFKYFKEVREKSPFYAPVYFNLGLVHEKNGKELAAIAWFHAYLASGTDQAEKAKIEAELLKLEVGAEAKANDILKQATQLADALPQGQYAQKEAYRSVYGGYVATGNLEEAEKFGSRTSVTTSGPDFMFSLTLASLAGELVETGDVTQAEKFAQQVTDGSQSSEAWLKIATYYAKKKDFAKVEALRPKIHSATYASSLTDIVKALVEGGRKDLAVKYGELGNAESFGESARIFAESGDKEAAKTFLVKAVASLKEDDTSGIDAAAYASIKAGDLDTLKILTGKMEKYLTIYPTPSIFTAKLAGYYSWLRNFKKADQIFATIPPDDPNNWAGKNRSIAAYEIMQAAIDQGDFKRFQSYLPYSHSGFLPSELGEMFAQLAWQKISEGKEKDAAKIMVSCPDGGSLAGWKIEDPNFYRDVMYHALAFKAAQAGQLSKAYEFAGKVTVKNWVIAAKSGSIGDALIQHEDLSGAKDFFEKEKDPNGGTPLGLIELAIQKGQMEEAREWFQQAEAMLVKNNDPYQVNQLITLAEKLHLTSQVQELKHLKTVNAWVALALKYENDTTFDPEKTYEEAKAQPPAEAPTALIRLSENYWKRLREIDFLKRSEKARG